MCVCMHKIRLFSSVSPHYKIENMWYITPYTRLKSGLNVGGLTYFLEQ